MDIEYYEPDVNRLLRRGIVVVDKPPGPSSHEVSSWVKVILERKRAGHSGTLDPLVTGVLPVGLDKATKVLPYLTKKKKEYVGVMRFSQPVTEEQVEEYFSAFRGWIDQLPPRKSAVKRRVRKRYVYRFDLVEIHDNRKDVLFDVECQAGTYIRALVRDISYKFNVRVRLTELRRIAVGHIRETEAHNLQRITDAYILWKESGDDRLLREVVKPLDVMLDLPRVYVNDKVVARLVHGSPLFIPGIYGEDREITEHNLKVLSGLDRDDTVGVYDLKGELVMIGRLMIPGSILEGKTHGELIRPVRVIMEPKPTP